MDRYHAQSSSGIGKDSQVLEHILGSREFCPSRPEPRRSYQKFVIAVNDKFRPFDGNILWLPFCLFRFRTGALRFGWPA
jgi:hypothetical protein